MKKNKKLKNTGAIALILVIMITALTVVSSVVIAMTNISDIWANYHFSEGKEVSLNMDACIDDALLKIASSTSATGTYHVNANNINCMYEISSGISAGYKTVTSTASTTSDVGFWQDSVVLLVNVSSSPITIDSYKNNAIGFDSYCGNGICGSQEDCSSCAVDCGSCAVCGDGIVQAGEVCDDNNTVTEGCGDGVVQSGTYCNADCSAEIILSETCDYTGSLCGSSSYSNPVGCGKTPYCSSDCSTCSSLCL